MIQCTIKVRIPPIGVGEMRTLPIIDLHCDLLTYLAKEGRSPFDYESRCSVNDLLTGSVVFQGMPLFTEGKEDWPVILKQVNAFQELTSKYAHIFKASENGVYPIGDGDFIGISIAIENASCVLNEQESLIKAFERLEQIKSQIGPILYISLTWNWENRFGGGAFVRDVGLKPDGLELIRFLHGKNVAVDLSHASDKLAYDLLNATEKEDLKISFIASHSNSRRCCEALRNLPDELIREIILRDGVIGLNFVRHFIGKKSFIEIKDHIEHFLYLGAEEHLVFGADFFYDHDLPLERQNVHREWYFSGFDRSSCYPQALSMFKNTLGIPDSILEKMAYKNAHRFLGKRVIEGVHYLDPIP
jgi:membrane dipeptidase